MDPTRRKGGHVEVEVCLIQAYGPKSSTLQPEFVEETRDALRKVKTNESMMLSGDFNAQLGYEAGAWHEGLASIVMLTQQITEDPYCNNALRVTNNVFQHRDLHNYAWWWWQSLGHRSLIRFRIVSADLFK